MQTWHGCYEGGWNDLIVPEAFAHPAKMSYALLKRIVQFGLDEGFWRPGDTIGDPFGGIGTTAIVTSYYGLRSVSVELEPRFVALANDNFALHRRKWEALGQPMPVFLQGDSRRFADLVGQVACCTYVSSPGQIGRLLEGALDGCITSPPYAKQAHHGGDTPTAKGIGRNTREQRPTEANGNHNLTRTYGATPGQIDELEPETYWSACAQVYAQCRLALRPGGVMALVVKDYVRNKARVPLCDQTCTLLERLGFTVFLRVRAMLVKERVHAGLFGEQTETKSRKSFFRRLCEKKGSPRIDWEEVIFSRAGE